MGLELKPAKTRLTHTLNECGEEKPGFDFLGFNIRQFRVGRHHSGKNPHNELLGFQTIITPSKQKRLIHYKRIASTIDDYKSATQRSLIRELNPIIKGWSNYYSTVCSKGIFTAIDRLMFIKLKRWAKRRHPRKSWKKWITKKYWQTIGGRNWVFATRQMAKNPMRLVSHDKTPISRHIKVRGKVSPYDGNLIYWSSRMGEHPEVTKRVATLLKEQKGKFTHCGLYFREEDVLEIDHIIPQKLGGKSSYENLQILHRHCHDTKTTNDGLVVKFT